MNSTTTLTGGHPNLLHPHRPPKTNTNPNSKAAPSQLYPNPNRRIHVPPHPINQFHPTHSRRPNPNPPLLPTPTKAASPISKILTPTGHIINIQPKNHIFASKDDKIQDHTNGRQSRNFKGRHEWTKQSKSPGRANGHKRGDPQQNITQKAAYICENTNQVSNFPDAFLSRATTDNWFLDSGASAHLTNNYHNLQNPSTYTGLDSITIGNGNQLPITHNGQYTIHTNNHKLHIPDLLYVPTLKHNLLSVYHLTKHNNCRIIFDSDTFTIQDKLTNSIIHQGQSSNGLYPLHQDPITLSAIHTNTDPWHLRLGHPHHDILHHLSTRFDFISSNTRNPNCNACDISKSHKLSFPLSSIKTTTCFQLVHTDLWGPTPTLSHQGFKYFLIFVDDFTRYTWLFPLKQKSDTFHCFTQFHQMVKNQFNTHLQRLRSDGGGEYTSHQFHEYLLNNGIQHQTSCPHTPEQNGISERKHRHIMETARTLLHHSSLPKQFWLEAASTATYLINRMPTKTLQMASPYSKLYNTNPSYAHLKVFGCLCYPWLAYPPHQKLDPKSTPCIFIGYSTNQKGFRCFDYSTKTLYISRHVKFHEHIFPFANLESPIHQPPTLPHLLPSYTQQDYQSIPPITNNNFPQHPPTPPVPETHNHPPKPPHKPHITYQRKRATHTQPESQHSPQTILQQHPHQPNSTYPRPQTNIPPLHPPNNQHPHQITPPTTYPRAIIPHQTPQLPNPSLPQIPIVLQQQTHHLIRPLNPTTSTKPRAITPCHPMQTRSKSTHQLHTTQNDNQLHFSQPQHDPTTYKQAISNQHWIDAMTTEIIALHKQNTWTLVPKPTNQTILGSKWTFKTKLNPDGTVSRYKARLVAQGFKQMAGLDYTDTFSPVAKLPTIRLLLILALQRDWHTTQIDISNAFLHGDLIERVYMHQPKGFEDPAHPSHVCLLRKSLYGLKQSSRQWNLALTSHLKQQGFHMSSADPSLYILHRGSSHVYILIYVDDLLVTGDDDSLISQTLQALGSSFQVRNLGPPKVFLGIQTETSAGGFMLHQHQYASSIVHLAGLDSCTAVSTPLPSRDTFYTATSKPFSNPKLYRKIVGSLQYLVITRPDIAHAVNIACQFMHDPQDHHFSLLTRIIRYIKGTLRFGLPIVRGDLHLTAYTDSDWAGDPTDRTSTTGYCIFLGPNLLTWKTQKQKTVARSSSEAEYRALSSTVTELIWLKRLLEEFDVLVQTPITLFCDNTSAISIAKNPILKARTKHVEIDHHFIREHISSGSINIQHIPTKDQVADIFTKRLPRVQFEMLCNKLTIQNQDH